MATTQSHPEERTARELLSRRAHYLGTDGEGTAHYFDWYSRELALIEADQETTLNLDETPFDTLRGWVEYTRQERGWAAEPNISSSVTGQLKGAVARTEL